VGSARRGGFDGSRRELRCEVSRFFATTALVALAGTSTGRVDHAAAALRPPAPFGWGSLAFQSRPLTLRVAVWCRGTGVSLPGSGRPSRGLRRAEDTRTARRALCHACLRRGGRRAEAPAIGLVPQVCTHEERACCAGSIAQRTRSAPFHPMRRRPPPSDGTGPPHRATPGLSRGGKMLLTDSCNRLTCTCT